MGTKFWSKTIWQSNTGINKAGKQIFRAFRNFRGISLDFIPGPSYMIMLLYDMKFGITSLDMIVSLPFVLFFSMHFLVSTQKAEANFQILQLNPYFDYWRRKGTITFSSMKSL